MLTLGIDPGPTFDQCHCRLLRELNGKYAFAEYGIDDVFRINKSCKIDAIVLEWINEKRGIFSDARSRAESILRTHSVGTSIRDYLLSNSQTVYCVYRESIIRQAGWNASISADKWVIDHLELHGFLTTKTTKTAVKRVETVGLTNVNDRDALMAALFNWRHPDNQQFKCTWRNNRCG